MPGHDEFDFERLDYRRLSADQWDALRRHVARRAERERALALRALFRSLGSALVRVARALQSAAAAAAAWWRDYLEERRRRQAMAELNGFGDRELKDIGVRRSEIYWAVHHGRVDPSGRVPSPPTAWSDADADAIAAPTQRGNDQRPVAA